jgi:hypothetical protein
MSLVKATFRVAFYINMPLNLVTIYKRVSLNLSKNQKMTEK